MMNKFKLFFNPQDTRLRLHFEEPFALTITSVKLFSYLSLGYGTVLASRIPNIFDIPRGKPFFKRVINKYFWANISIKKEKEEVTCIAR